MSDFTEQFIRACGARGRLVVTIGCLLGCGGSLSPRAPGPPEVDVDVTPDANLRGLAVTACTAGPMAFRPWAAAWSRVTVTEGTRDGDTLRTSASGCVGYRVALSASRSTQFADGVTLSAHSDWLLRPVGTVGAVHVRFRLPAGSRVAAPWPTLSAQGHDAQGPRGTHEVHDTDDTHDSDDRDDTDDPHGARDTTEPTSRTEFVLPPLALQLPSDVLLGRFELSRAAVGDTQLEVARVAGSLPHSQGELVAHIARAVDMVRSVGGTFPSERVLAIIWPSPSDQPVQFGLTKRGGGASIILFFGQQAPAGSLDDDWVSVHELAHLLHPLVLPQDRWLSEGIATYYQEVLRARAGWKTPERAWARIIEGFDAGRRGGTGRSLSDEADAMHQTAAYTRVYWGGAAFVLAADMRLRARGSSMDEALARCVREVQRSARPVSARDLVRVFDPELVGLADEYAARGEWAPTDALLSELGLVYEGERVRFVDAPGSAVRDAIMGAAVGAPE